MTSQSPLDRLAGPGNALSKEPPAALEFAGLVESGLARLADAENRSNSLYGRFDLACSAAHALCQAALRYRGLPFVEAVQRVPDPHPTLRLEDPRTGS